MPPREPRPPIRAAAIAGGLLHLVAVLLIWRRHGAGTGGLVLFWMDFPVSLVYAGLTGGAYWLASVVAGTALWAAAAVLLTLLVGRLARRA